MSDYRPCEWCGEPVDKVAGTGCLHPDCPGDPKDERISELEAELAEAREREKNAWDKEGTWYRKWVEEVAKRDHDFKRAEKAEAEVGRLREALEPQLRAAFRAGVARAVASTYGFVQTHSSEDEWVSLALAGQEGGGDGR